MENCLENLSGKARRVHGEGDYGDAQISYYDDDERDISCDSDGEEKGIDHYHEIQYILSNVRREETTTIVGTKLHGPTFDEELRDEMSKEVSAYLTIPFCSTNTFSTNASPSATHGRTRK